MSTELELTASAILDADDIVSERVEVPEWGGFLFVRGLTGRERDAFEQSMIERKGRGGAQQVKLDNVRAGLGARCIVDSSGIRLFTDQQVEALGKKSAAALDRIYDVAARLSGLGEKDVESLVEDFSEGTPEPSTLA